jgi:hypothetical protein
MVLMKLIKFVIYVADGFVNIKVNMRLNLI